MNATDIEEIAEERGCNDASSLYPYRRISKLIEIGEDIARHDYELEDHEISLFAEEYASAYDNEIDVFDRDECYEYYGLDEASFKEFLADLQAEEHEEEHRDQCHSKIH